jgi:parallel beta-helix repeat protein
VPAIGLVVFACALFVAALTPPEVFAPSALAAHPAAVTPTASVALSGDAPQRRVRTDATWRPPAIALTAVAQRIAAPPMPLGARPDSGALSYWGACPAVIEGHTFRGLGPGVVAIHLEECSNVLIRDNDFIDVAEGIYVVRGSNISVIGNRFQNIVGPSARDGGIHGNFVMFNAVSGGLIARNEGRCGDTEDTISLYRSSHVIVAANYLEGTFEDAPGCLAWRSLSGTGINVNDGGGTGNIVRDNTLLNPHRVGIGVAGGTDTRVENNVVYSARRQGPDTAIGIAAENYSGEPCAGITIRGNRVRWTNSDGGAFPIWADGGCRTASDRLSRRNDDSLDPDTLFESFRASTGWAEAAADASLGPGDR